MDDSEVFVGNGIDPISALEHAVESIGGIKEIVKANDKVLIKPTLNHIEGFPAHSNFQLLKFLVKECIEAGASEIFVGSSLDKHLNIAKIDEIKTLSEELKSFNTQFIYFDDEILYKEVVLEDLQEIVEVPEILFECDKYIILNQINVDPLFDLSISILNAYSLIPSKFRKIMLSNQLKEKIVKRNQYKETFISKILDIYKIRKPDLVINDLYYVMENAGPHIYKDSNLVKTNLILLGSDAIAVDLSTLKVLGLNPDDNELIKTAMTKKLTSIDIDKLKYKGDSLEDFEIEINLCETNLESLQLYGTDIKLGKVCSGCYEQAYRLFNFMKTYMSKDLTYITKQSILLGLNPNNPEYIENVILFGDCAINSTKEYDFRTIKKKKEKIPLTELIKKGFNKKKVENRKIKTVQKKNERILNLSGCPPNINEVLKAILEFYGRRDVPNLNFFCQSKKIIYSGDKRL